MRRISVGPEAVSIGEAAGRSGVSAKMIRHYQALGILPERRLGNRYRTFTEAEVATLRLAAALRELNVPLAEVRAIAGADGEAPRDAALARLAAALDAKAAALRVAREAVRGPAPRRVEAVA
jgi:DNA-binding transcriptional MerR regulator